MKKKMGMDHFQFQINKLYFVKYITLICLASENIDICMPKRY